MRKIRLRSTAVLFLIFILLGSSSALAQQAGEEKNWQFNLAPFYLWAVTIDGDLTVGNISAPVKLPFSDIVDNLEAAFIVHFEAMHQSGWGFLIDVNYLDLSNDVTVPIGPGVPANVDFDTTLAEVSGLYRINRDEHNFDLIAGVRYTELETKVTRKTGPNPVLADDSKDWADPLIGARWLWGFTDKWTLAVRGDIGGFGVGSDLALQGLAAVDWRPVEYVSFIGGYRALYQDYIDDSGTTLFRYDATIHGPLLGVNFRW